MILIGCLNNLFLKNEKCLKINRYKYIMKFCEECSSILLPSTATGTLIFKCKCGKTYDSTPEDSLRYEEYMESSESKEKYKIFIENSPFDPARLLVDRRCYECNAPYLTMIYVGKNETPIYTCTCGKKYTNKELKTLEKKYKNLTTK